MQKKNKSKQLSKYLSFLLRHQPDSIGLSLDEHGWVKIEELVDAASLNGKCISRNEIEKVVAVNDKKRFSISKDGSKIRANQGHSIMIDLGLKSKEPPELLFHGTAMRFLDSIYQKGLLPSGRHHVHLSVDYETAKKVGTRHGKPAVLKIDVARMYLDGAEFYLSENGVWLTNHVSPEFISLV